MKIALVYFNLTVQAGGQRQLFSLARQLQNLGHTVVIYTAEFNQGYFTDLWRGLSIRVIGTSHPFSKVLDVAQESAWGRVRKKWRVERLYAEAARRIAEAMEDDFDVVNCHEDFAYKVGFFYSRRNPKSRIVWTMNNPPFMYLPKSNRVLDVLSRAYSSYKDLSERRFWRAIDAVTVLSRYELSWAKRRGLPAHIVWSGVDFEAFFAPVRDPTAQGTFQLIGVGAVTPYRRFEDIVWATKMLRDTAHDVRALLVCKDLWNEAAYKTKLLETRREAGMEPYVEFLFDGVSEAGLKDVYRQSHIFVLSTHIPPPHGYGWGLSVFEAIAAGLPALICRSGGAADVLTDCENAVFVDPARPDQIASQVRRLIDDPGFYHRLAEAGQQFVKANISWQRYAERMIEIFAGGRRYEHSLSH